jgi:hypothetical protein
MTGSAGNICETSCCPSKAGRNYRGICLKWYSGLWKGLERRSHAKKEKPRESSRGFDGAKPGEIRFDAFAKIRRMAKQKFRPARLGGFSGAKAYF